MTERHEQRIDAVGALPSCVRARAFWHRNDHRGSPLTRAARLVLIGAAEICALTVGVRASDRSRFSYDVLGTAGALAGVSPYCGTGWFGGRRLHAVVTATSGLPGKLTGGDACELNDRGARDRRYRRRGAT